MVDRQRGHPFPTGVEERAATDEQRTSPTLGERCKGRLDVAIAAGFDNDELLSDSLGKPSQIGQKRTASAHLARSSSSIAGISSIRPVASRMVRAAMWVPRHWALKL
jgi:nucleotidyltransferase/DNA polymerase involved in DNA repair